MPPAGREPKAASRRPPPGLPPPAASRQTLLALLGAFCAAAAPGCVERLLQVRSEPPGATVYLNGKPVGVTPLDHPFDFYGTFDVTLRSAHHFSLHRLESVPPPWYEVFPLDFFAENIVPFRIRDHRQLSYTLEPAPPLGEGQIDREIRGARDRLEALEGRLTPPAAGSTP